LAKSILKKSNQHTRQNLLLGSNLSNRRTHNQFSFCKAGMPTIFQSEEIQLNPNRVLKHSKVKASTYFATKETISLTKCSKSKGKDMEIFDLSSRLRFKINF
jgi:hypothetical protein